ncbi:MAG TPA: hypothetical protein VF439_01705 [Candidatus Paceibacterota bacterium]
MSEQIQLISIILGLPIIMVVFCWIALMVTMHKTTGELKLFLTPDNLIKGVTIIFVVCATLVLSILQIIDGAIAGALLSGVVGYTLGTGFNR